MRSFAFLTAFLLPINIAAAQVPTVERNALIALYEATDGADWIDDTNWRNPGDNAFNVVGTECSWAGVTCSAGKNVTEIDLIGYQLVGTLPPELGNLPSLRGLWLNGCRLSGRIPPELGKLSRLEHLVLIGNQLSGSIPPELSELSRLLGLGLHHNQLSGNTPEELGNLSSLQSLNLSGNQLSGNLPPNLRNLPNFRDSILDED